MLWNSNTVIRQKAEDVSTAIFRGSSRTSRLHWIICFAICSQTGSWLKQADCSYSYQRGLFGHMCDQDHSVLRTQAQLLIINFLYDIHYGSFFFPDEFLFIHLSHTKLPHVPPASVCSFTQPDMLQCWPPAICSLCRLNLCEFSRPLALQRGKRHIFRINKKSLLL